MSPPQKKVCPNCPERGLQPLDNFYKCTSAPDGHQYVCKVCQRARVLASFRKHGRSSPTAYREYQRDYLRDYRQGKRRRQQEQPHTRI